MIIILDKALVNDKLDVNVLESILLDNGSWGDLKLKLDDYINVIHDELSLKLKLEGIHNQKITCMVGQDNKNSVYYYNEDEEDFSVLNRIILYLKKNYYKLYKDGVVIE